MIKHKRCWLCKNLIMNFIFLTLNGYECESCNKALEQGVDLTPEAKAFNYRLSKLDKPVQ